MRNVCNDGYYCCQPQCYEINEIPINNVNDCENCMLVGGYYVHGHDSVPAGCGAGSLLQVVLDRNNYDACDGTLSFKIWDYDETYFENVTIQHLNDETSILLTIKAEIPLEEYKTIVYKVMCSDGKGAFGRVHVASKHLCIECPCECDECTGDCDEPC